MRLTVIIIGLLAVLSSVAVEGFKRKKYHRRRGASHYGGYYRRGQFPGSHLGRHGPFGLHGSHDPPTHRFRTKHDDILIRRPWQDSYESSEGGFEYDRRIDKDGKRQETSSEEDWHSRERPPCPSRRRSTRKPPCQRNTTPPPIQTTKDWWESKPRSTAGYWETVLSWPTNRPTTRQTREPVGNSDMNVTTTVRPEETTIAQDIIDCVRNCTFRTTSQFLPVCGTDGETYDNIGRLFCAKTCGINVELRRTSVCPPPPFPDYEDVDENGSGNGDENRRGDQTRSGDENRSGDQTRSGDENRSRDDGEGETSPPPTPPPTPPTTINPRFIFQTTLLTRYQQCMKICPITLNYNPVCGTDLVTYFNVDRLICARECGQDVEVLCEKPCTVCTWRTTTTTTTPRTLPQSTTTHRNIAQSTARVNDARTTRASMELCFKACPITSEHNPVCGTNNVNYTNPGHLLCAQMCGEDVKVSTFAPCPSPTETPTTTTEEDYDDGFVPPHILACTTTCPTTPEYNPVCGTNGGTYFNIGRLECDRYCGVDVQMSYKGLCIGFLPPFLTSLSALDKMTPIWKTPTLSTPTTPLTPLKLSIIQSDSTTSSITWKTPITSSWNSPTIPSTITETPITSPWNTPKTSSRTLETPITSAWNTPPTLSPISNALKTSLWNTPTTPSTLLLDSQTTTPSTSSWDTESTILSTLPEESTITPGTSPWDSTLTTQSTASRDSLSTTPSPFSSDSPSITPSPFSSDSPSTTASPFLSDSPSTTPSSFSSDSPLTTPLMSSTDSPSTSILTYSSKNSPKTAPSTFLQDSPTTVPSTTTWESPTTMPFTSSLDLPSTTLSNSKTLDTSTQDTSSTPWVTESTSKVLTTVNFTIAPDILASIFNLPTRVEISTQPNIVTTVAEEDFSLDPRFGDNAEENAKRVEDDMNSRIVFPDDR